MLRIRVATGSAVGPVKRDSAVGRAGWSRLVVFVVRVFAGFVFANLIYWGRPENREQVFLAGQRNHSCMGCVKIPGLLT